METRRLLGAAQFALLMIVPACFSYTPPVRTGIPGAPGKVSEGTTEIAATTNALLSWGAAVGHGLTDELAIEAGMEGPMIMFGGVRYTPLTPGRKKLALVFDLEAGMGGGAASLHCDRGQCTAQPMGGTYFGLGLGAKVWFWSPYLRGRQQVSAAVGRPVTSLTTGTFGMQFSIIEHVHAWVGTGGGLLSTDEGNSEAGWYQWDVGLSVTFGGKRQREAIERLRQRRSGRARRVDPHRTK